MPAVPSMRFGVSPPDITPQGHGLRFWWNSESYGCGNGRLGLGSFRRPALLPPVKYGAVHQDEPVVDVLRRAKRVAQEYRLLTGKPLGITGEVAEYEAARLLELELTPARQAGYDAIERRDGRVRRLQVKGRCLLPGCKPGQRLGSILIEKEWDAVLMVILDENFDALEIYEADRAAVTAALTAPGSKSRNIRGSLSVSKFRRIGARRWQRKPVPK